MRQVLQGASGTAKGNISLLQSASGITMSDGSYKMRRNSFCVQLEFEIIV